MTWIIARAALAAVALGALPLALSSGEAAEQGAAQPAPAATPAAGNPVVARVNGVEVHRSDLEEARQELPAQYQQIPIDSIYRPLLERVVDGALITAAGRKAGLQNDAEVKAKLVHAEDQLIRSIYLSREVKAKLTDAVLKQRYQAYLKANPPEPEVSARHILLKSEEEAKEVIKQLKGGADFVELAKKHSTGSAGEEDGNLGYIKKGDVVPEFAEVAFKLKPGQYTETPVKTQFGWHVIKIEAVRTSQPPTFEEAKEEISQEASREIISATVKDLEKGAKIERFGLDGGPLKEEEPAKAPEAAPKAEEKKQP